MCPLLQQLLRRTDSPGAVKARVLRCLSSWVLLDVPLSESEGLVHDCFSALQDPELFDTAVEAIVNAISQPDSQRCVDCGGESSDTLVRTGNRGKMQPRRGRIDTGQVKSQGEESSISRLAGVAMVTMLGRDVIMPWLIQIWQAPITPSPGE